MITGIGTDLVDINRLSDGIERFGERYVSRILGDQELQQYEQLPQTRRIAFLAKRFAAKEAAAKAFGTGFRDGLSLRHIQVISDEAGRPSLHFSARAAELARERGVEEGHVSLSDEGHYALAFVTLVRQ